MATRIVLNNGKEIEENFKEIVALMRLQNNEINQLNKRILKCNIWVLLCFCWCAVLTFKLLLGGM